MPPSHHFSGEVEDAADVAHNSKPSNSHLKKNTYIAIDKIMHRLFEKHCFQYIILLPKSLASRISFCKMSTKCVTQYKCIYSLFFFASNDSQELKGQASGKISSPDPPPDHSDFTLIFKKNYPSRKVNEKWILADTIKSSVHFE